MRSMKGCGITPIQQMLEINAIDDSRPSQSKSPAEPQKRAELSAPASLLEGARMVPIETPLTFAGFHEATLREFRPWFDQMGITPVQGGAAGSVKNTTPAPGWQNALQPGDAIAIPPGQIHQITNSGPALLKFLCCCSPAYEHSDTVLV